MATFRRLEVEESGFIEAGNHSGDRGEALCAPASIQADRNQMKVFGRRLDLDDHPAIQRDLVSLAARRRFDESLARAADAPVESDGGSRLARLNRVLDLDARHRR